MKKRLIGLFAASLLSGTANAAIVEFNVGGNPSLLGGPLSFTTFSAKIVLDTGAAEKDASIEWSNVVKSIEVSTVDGLFVSAGPVEDDLFFHSDPFGADAFSVTHFGPFSSNPSVVRIDFQAVAADGISFFNDLNGATPLDALVPGAFLDDDDFSGFSFTIGYADEVAPTILRQNLGTISARVLPGEEVSPVPIPGALPLMAAGLGCFGLTRRKRKLHR